MWQGRCADLLGHTRQTAPTTVKSVETMPNGVLVEKTPVVVTRVFKLLPDASPWYLPEKELVLPTMIGDEAMARRTDDKVAPVEMAAETALVEALVEVIVEMVAAETAVETATTEVAEAETSATAAMQATMRKVAETPTKTAAGEAPVEAMHTVPAEAPVEASPS